MSHQAELQFDLTASEKDIIRQIAQRAAGMFESVDQLSLRMDITVCHKYDTPLDLEGLLNFEPYAFAHDIMGIEAYIDRNTGKLRNHFLPRCARVPMRNSTGQKQKDSK